MKYFMQIVRTVSKEDGIYDTIEKREIKKDEEYYTKGDNLYLVDLSGSHVRDEKGNKIYYYDYDTGNIITMRQIEHPSKFYEPKKLDMFLKKKILQQIWGKIRDASSNSDKSWIIFILLGIGVGIGIGIIVGHFITPTPPIIVYQNSTTPLPTI